MKNIVLFGTGNLGKRYIQAISKLYNVKLILNDISLANLISVKEFLRLNGIKKLNYEMISKTDDAVSKIDEETIVIISTTSNNRLSTLKPVILRHPEAVICEKPVTQKLENYLELLKLIKENNTRSFVDFTLRMQPFYQKIKAEIYGMNSGVFYSNLPNMGLACVGIHQIDLFMWLFGLNNCEIKNSTFIETYEQKRKGFYDIVGSIELQSGNFKGFINNSSDESFRTAQIITDHAVYNVHEDQKVFTKITKGTQGNPEIEALTYSFVSQYMADVINNIINKNYKDIPLPDLEFSFSQHKILFDYLKKHNLEELNFT